MEIRYAKMRSWHIQGYYMGIYHKGPSKSVKTLRSVQSASRPRCEQPTSRSVTARTRSLGVKFWKPERLFLKIFCTESGPDRRLLSIGVSSFHFLSQPIRLWSPPWQSLSPTNHRAFVKVLRPATSTVVFLGFPVSKSKCWDGSQDSKLPLRASHVALQI